MYCPVCRDEYRPGFTRCATCDVDLVASLVETDTRTAPAAVVAEVAAEEGMINFCGFLTLEEARAARDVLRAAKIRAEILICEAPSTKLDAPLAEEFWLRVLPRDTRTVSGLIGYEPAAPVESDDESFQCSACGSTVQATDTKCPGCGLGFDE